MENEKNLEINLDIKSALIIGFLHILSLIPGVSRSGIAITAARFLKFDIFNAAKISFLLSIPTLLAVSVFGGYKIYITESGCSFDTSPNNDGIINDKNRVKYHKEHIKEMKRAIDAGVPCSGYFAWSLMDNFEWCEGYSQRFGLVWIDYKTLERIPKDSYWWYKKFITKN